MQLTRADFEKRYAENTLRIAFVGMSNIGKSYTGSRLSKAFNFDLIQVDELIWEALGQGSMDWYVVHISASESDVENLKVRYFEQPKPLIWNGHYVRNSEQTETEAILTSYPELLASRAKAYAALADVTIGSNVILNPKVTIEDIFEALKPAI